MELIKDYLGNKPPEPERCAIKIAVIHVISAVLVLCIIPGIVHGKDDLYAMIIFVSGLWQLSIYWVIKHAKSKT